MKTNELNVFERSISTNNDLTIWKIDTHLQKLIQSENSFINFQKIYNM